MTAVIDLEKPELKALRNQFGDTLAEGVIRQESLRFSGQ